MMILGCIRGKLLLTLESRWALTKVTRATETTGRTMRMRMMVPVPSALPSKGIDTS